MTKRYEGKGLLRPSVLRGIVIAVVMAAAVVSILFHSGWGTISAFGLGDLYLLCPLGGLEAMLGTKSILVHALIAIVMVGLVVLLVGKAFCAWGCPTAVLSRFLSGKKGREAAKHEQMSCAKMALAAFEETRCASGCGGCSTADCASKDRRKAKLDSRHFVLAGALGSALIFGFPVFCLVCPIGLTFATIIAWVRLVGFNEPSIGLVLFPLIIVVELVVLRKWCHTLCPVGALLSLVSQFNRTLRPKVNTAKCLRYAKDEPCSVCSSVCPELIDPHSDLGLRPLTECTRCGKCAEACPQGAISFVRAKAAKDRQPVMLEDVAPE